MFMCETAEVKEPHVFPLRLLLLPPPPPGEGGFRGGGERRGPSAPDSPELVGSQLVRANGASLNLWLAGRCAKIAPT